MKAKKIVPKVSPDLLRPKKYLTKSAKVFILWAPAIGQEARKPKTPFPLFNGVLLTLNLKTSIQIEV